MSSDRIVSATDERVQQAPRAATTSGGLRGAWAGWPGTIARVVFALLPLLWLAKRVDASTLLARALQVGPSGIGGALLWVVASLASGALRWRTLLLAYGANPATTPSYLSLFRSNVIGVYFGVLPSGMAGEAYRGWRTASCFADPTTSYVVLLVERLAGLLGLLAIAGVGVWFSPDPQGGALVHAFNAGLLLALCVGLVFFVLPQWFSRAPWLREWIGKIPVFGALLVRVPAAKSVSKTFAALLLSVVSQGATVMTVASLLGPLSSVATVMVCARIVPAIVLVTYVPLTPGGLGQREAAFVHFFGRVGVEAAAAVAASLLFFAMTIVMALTGGAFLLFERAQTRASSTHE